VSLCPGLSVEALGSVPLFISSSLVYPSPSSSPCGSRTCTVLVTVFPVFPALSVREYSKVYVPIWFMFTIQLVGGLIVPLPSKLSVQLAQLSV
jgi:hypothetical protein